MSIRKVCILTGTRAEYGLLFHLMKAIQDDDLLELQIIATGTHLSPEFGLTYREIEKDGFCIDEKIEMLLSGDNPVSVTKSMGVELISLSESLKRLAPDVIVLLGDRYEILMMAISALVANVPVAHIAGGDITEGSIDDSIRHCVTKLSHIHFVANLEHAKRVRQLGENPSYIYEVGLISLDNIFKMKFLSLNELEKSIGFTLGEKYFLVTYHPVTVKGYSEEDSLQNLFAALYDFPKFKILFTKSNGDAGGASINRQIDTYAKKNPERVFVCPSLGQIRYLSAMKNCSAVIGNSSSGLLEAPALKVPTINVGVRQQGRQHENSVIDCVGSKDSIVSAIEKAISPQFKSIVHSMSTKHMDGNVAVRIKNILRDISLEGLCKKHFFDLI